jgi:hypothetical protein
MFTFRLGTNGMKKELGRHRGTIDDIHVGSANYVGKNVRV